MTLLVIWFASGENLDPAASMQELSATLLEFQKSGYLCDTVVVADDGQVKAHSAVLAAASHVFKQVLMSNDQPLQHTILLPGMQLATISVIIEFAYSGKVVITKDKYCDSAKIMAAIKELGIKLHLRRLHFILIYQHMLHSVLMFCLVVMWVHLYH